MRARFYLLSTPGGRLVITWTTLVFGVLTDAIGVQLGHDITIGALGALLAQLQPHTNGNALNTTGE